MIIPLKTRILPKSTPEMPKTKSSSFCKIFTPSFGSYNLPPFPRLEHKHFQEGMINPTTLDVAMPFVPYLKATKEKSFPNNFKIKLL